MKITFVGHASLLIEARGIRVLSDPWWSGPCFGAQWWLYPEPFLDPIRDAPPQYVYISHGHHDHFHPTTLKTLSRDVTVLVPKGVGLADPVRDLGFRTVELTDEDEHELGAGVTGRIVRTDGDDSLMVVSDGTETCLNVNDALHSSPRSVQLQFARMLRSRYPRIDYVFCGYGVASHFPNCYVIPGKDRERSAANRQRHFNQAWANVVHDLSPRFAFPFAADVVFLEEDLFWANEPTHNTERPTEAFRRAYPDAATTVLDIAPGFVIENGTVTSERLRQRIDSGRLRDHFADSIRRVNRPPHLDRASVQELVPLLRDNIQRCRPYLASFRGDYRCLLRFRNASGGIAIQKRGADIIVGAGDVDGARGDAYDLIYTTRTPYLHKSLTSEYGHETLFVGSGGIFEYRDARAARRNIHRELSLIMRQVRQPPAPRPAGLRAWASSLRRRLKQAAGRDDGDLYDLTRWTVFAA
jgi:hypothetical protein